MKKDQERHARYKEDDTLRKWAVKKKKRGGQMLRRSLLLRKLLLFMFKRSQVNHLYQPLALHFRVDNLFIRAFQEPTCIYQRAPTKTLKLIKGQQPNTIDQAVQGGQGQLLRESIRTIVLDCFLYADYKKVRYTG